MLTTGKFVYFNYTQYEEQAGRSYGFAQSPDHNRPIFLGTLFRVFPEIAGDKIIMGRERNLEALDTEMPLEGKEVMVDTRELKKGLGGSWCFVEEWQLMQERQEFAQAWRHAAEEEAKRIEDATKETRRRLEAEAEKRRTENPRTIEEALAHGWTIIEKSPNGRQVRLGHQFSGEKKDRVITRYTAKKPARVSPQTVSRFATA